MNEGKNDNPHHWGGFGSGQIQPPQRPRITPQMAAPPTGASSVPGFPPGWPEWWGEGDMPQGWTNPYAPGSFVDGVWTMDNGMQVYPPTDQFPVWIETCPAGAPCSGGSDVDQQWFFDDGPDDVPGTIDDGMDYGGPPRIRMWGGPDHYNFNGDGSITYLGDPPGCASTGNCTGFPPGVYQDIGGTVRYLIDAIWVASHTDIIIPPGTTLVILYGSIYGGGGYYLDRGEGASPRYTVYGGGGIPLNKMIGSDNTLIGPDGQPWGELTTPPGGETWAQWWDDLSFIEQMFWITLLAAGTILAGWAIYEWWHNQGGSESHSNNTDCPSGQDCGPVIPGGGTNNPIVIPPGGSNNNNNSQGGQGGGQVWNPDNENPDYKV